MSITMPAEMSVMPSVAHCLAACALPALEARALLAHVSGLSREALIAFPERALDETLQERFEVLSTRRLAGEPLAYLVGEKEFYGRPFRVGPDVLIPRPETELLVDTATAHARAYPTPRVLDLGTGSGCIAITLALELDDAHVCAVDQSAAALAMARANAQQLGACVDFIHSDWFTAVQGTFDLIVSNPPYIAADDKHLHALRHEPQRALTDAADGLSCLRHIARIAPAHLTPGGWLLVEHGHDQGLAVRKLFAHAGLVQVQTLRDLEGRERLCMGRRAAHY